MAHLRTDVRTKLFSNAHTNTDIDMVILDFIDIFRDFLENINIDIDEDIFKNTDR